jgi:hypothetical protein
MREKGFTNCNNRELYTNFSSEMRKYIVKTSRDLPIYYAIHLNFIETISIKIINKLCFYYIPRKPSEHK